MTFGIPLYLYVEARTPQEAAALKVKLEEMLQNPLIKMALKRAAIPEKGFRVLDPQLAPG
jgi:hypothetical protein